MLGARTAPEPGDERGFQLRVGGLGSLAPELGQAHRLTEGAQIQRGTQAGRDGFRCIVAHVAIVGRRLCPEKVCVEYSTAP